VAVASNDALLPSACPAKQCETEFRTGVLSRKRREHAMVVVAGNRDGDNAVCREAAKPSRQRAGGLKKAV
jgi:hypothetical protein